MMMRREGDNYAQTPQIRLMRPHDSGDTQPITDDWKRAASSSRPLQHATRSLLTMVTMGSEEPISAAPLKRIMGEKHAIFAT